MSHPPIPRINEHNEIIGETTIAEAVSNNWHRRVARVFLFDESNRILLQKRSMVITGYPGLWDQSAGGHVDVGETEYEAAVRETKEEIGIEVPLLEVASAHHLNLPRDPQFNYVYRAVINSATTFTLEPTAVSELRWFTIDEFEQLATEEVHTFVPAFLIVWRQLRDKLIT